MPDDLPGIHEHKLIQNMHSNDKVASWGHAPDIFVFMEATTLFEMCLGKTLSRLHTLPAE